MNALRLVTELSVPELSGAPKNGNRYAAKLTVTDVQEIRRFARQEGFTRTQTEQIRWLRSRGYTEARVTYETLRRVLINESFHDPAYDPTTPDRDWVREDDGSVRMMARVHRPTPPPGAAITDDDKWRIHDEQLHRIEVEVAGNPDALARVRALRADHAARRSG